MRIIMHRPNNSLSLSLLPFPRAEALISQPASLRPGPASSQSLLSRLPQVDACRSCRHNRIRGTCPSIFFWTISTSMGVGVIGWNIVILLLTGMITAMRHGIWLCGGIQLQKTAPQRFRKSQNYLNVIFTSAANQNFSSLTISCLSASNLQIASICMWGMAAQAQNIIKLLVSRQESSLELTRLFPQQLSSDMLGHRV